jgi:hypothetical protein
MFEGGFKTCIKCRGKKLARYYRKLEYYQEMRKTWRENNPERVKESNEEYSKRTHFCDVCNYEIRLKDKKRHEQTEYHKDRLKRRDNPEEFENEEKPYHESVVDGKVNFYCPKCKVGVLSSKWSGHISSEQHQKKK